MERDEFMNVDGEAEFDVDIMKELRYQFAYHFWRMYVGSSWKMSALL